MENFSANPVSPAVDLALRNLRADNDQLLLVAASLRATLLECGRIAIDAQQTEINRLSRIATLVHTGIVASRGVERRTWRDRLAAWWQTRRAR